jgi:glycosyltransferase involved in cell wall biosynthesis
MQKRTKVIHIITRVDVGGTSKDILNICHRFDKNWYESILVHGPSQIECHSAAKIYKIPYMVREISPLKDLISLFKLYAVIKNEKPGIVHTHSSKAGFIGRWAAFFAKHFNQDLKNMKIIHSPHGHVFYGYEFSWIKTRIFLLLERLSAPITDLFIALTEGEKEESIGYGVGKPHQWKIVHSGCELDRTIWKPLDERQKSIKRGEFDIPDNAIVIGTVSRLVPVKGIIYLLKTIPLLMKSLDEDTFNQLVFLVVGDGSERKKLQKYANKFSDRIKILFTGTRSDVCSLMSIMDIYVQPSLNEGMGITLIQAQSVNLPVIASRVQGIPDVVKDRETGILVSPKKPQLIAQAIQRLILNPELKNKMGVAARKWSCEEIDGLPVFCPERMIMLLKKIYDEISK